MNIFVDNHKKKKKKKKKTQQYLIHFCLLFLSKYFGIHFYNHRVLYQSLFWNKDLFLFYVETTITINCGFTDSIVRLVAR